MDNFQIQRTLVQIGLGIGSDARMMAIDGDIGPRTRDAIKRFQQGWVNYLVDDGISGKYTQDALSLCAYLGGLASQHFRFREFACSHCGYINCKRGMIDGCEAYRAAFSPGGMKPLSGTRCPAHNRDVGGAQNSRHLDGDAADLYQIKPFQPVRDLRRYSGIEISSAHLICHIDTRHLYGGGFSVDNPAVFTWPTTLADDGLSTKLCHL